MKYHSAFAALLLILLLIVAPPILAAEETRRLAALDAYWEEVSRAVGAGDYEAYAATCHPQGVLVSGVEGTSQPLSVALARWKPEFDDTKAGRVKASVSFRFSQRLGDETTAHETGIFLYNSVNAAGEITREHIFFEGLLLKREGHWKILMEYQKSKASEEEWGSLAGK